MASLGHSGGTYLRVSPRAAIRVAEVIAVMGAGRRRWASWHSDRRAELHTHQQRRAGCALRRTGEVRIGGTAVTFTQAAALLLAVIVAGAVLVPRRLPSGAE